MTKLIVKDVDGYTLATTEYYVVAAFVAGMSEGNTVQFGRHDVVWTEGAEKAPDCYNGPGLIDGVVWAGDSADAAASVIQSRVHKIVQRQTLDAMEAGGFDVMAVRQILGLDPAGWRSRGGAS